MSVQCGHVVCVVFEKNAGGGEVCCTFMCVIAGFDKHGGVSTWAYKS